MSKEQKALDELRSLVHDEYDGTTMLNEHLEYCDTLQELIDQQPTATLSECIKEWEEKNFIVSLCEGYLFIKKYSTHWQDCVIVISIDINGKEYKTEDDFYITFELHNLLSKTLKALEVEDE